MNNNNLDIQIQEGRCYLIITACRGKAAGQMNRDRERDSRCNVNEFEKSEAYSF